MACRHRVTVRRFRPRWSSSASRSEVAIDSHAIDPATTSQIERVTSIIRRVLGGDLTGAYLTGSAVLGGLKPKSDLDVLVVSARPLAPTASRDLIAGLLPISGSLAAMGPARSIELTIVVESDVRPWRYPPPLAFQYGDWWRREFEAGDLHPWTSPNPDLAVLLTAARHDAIVLVGRPVTAVLDPVPRADLDRAMVDGIPGLLADLDDDTRNVVLTLARIWTTLATGRIHPKDEAADWVLERLPVGERSVLARARAIYVGDEPERWDDLWPSVRPQVETLIASIDRETRSAS